MGLGTSAARPGFRKPCAVEAGALHDVWGARPPAFPSSVRLYMQTFRNWSGEICTEALWTCVPATPNDVVVVANWAHGRGWRMRPRGRAHNWSPLVIPRGDRENVLIVDTTHKLTAVRVSLGAPASVTAQSGVT